MTTRVPNPAYPAKSSAVLYGDKVLYGKLGIIAEQDGGKQLIEEFEIPIRSGKAWVVEKGGSLEEVYFVLWALILDWRIGWL
jgi:hypothetical protein